MDERAKATDAAEHTEADFIERMGVIAQADGLPRIAGRLMSFFVIHGGPVGFGELSERLRISRRRLRAAAPLAPETAGSIWATAAGSSSSPRSRSSRSSRTTTCRSGKRTTSFAGPKRRSSASRASTGPRCRSAVEATMLAGAQRLRPVVLTTVLGLLPMMLAMTVDLIGRDIAFGAPSTQFWTDLSTAIGGGLSFATVLTLVLTPCMLVLGANVSERWGRRRRRGALELTSDPRVPAE